MEALQAIRWPCRYVYQVQKLPTFQPDKPGRRGNSWVEHLIRLAGLTDFRQPCFSEEQCLWSYVTFIVQARTSRRQILRPQQPYYGRSTIICGIYCRNLAGNIATKGYRYLQSVKDCPEDVRRLIAEVNVLCGILSRLTILLNGRKRGTGASTDPVFHESNGLDDVSD